MSSAYERNWTDPALPAAVLADRDPGVGGEPRLEPVSWPEFWRRDRSAQEWLYEDVLVPGRGHSIYAKRGVGKSLFCPARAPAAARSPGGLVNVSLGKR